MTNRKLHGIMKKMLTVSDRAVIRSFHAEAKAEIENVREVARDPKLAKVRAQIVDRINHDIAEEWRQTHSAGNPPRLDFDDVTWSIVAEKDAKGQMNVKEIKLRGVSRKEVTIPGRPSMVAFQGDVAVAVDGAPDASRDPKLAKARSQVVGKINGDIAQLWRERRLPGQPPEVAEGDLTFDLR